MLWTERKSYSLQVNKVVTALKKKVAMNRVRRTISRVANTYQGKVWALEAAASLELRRSPKAEHRRLGKRCLTLMVFQEQMMIKERPAIIGRL